MIEFTCEVVECKKKKSVVGDIEVVIKLTTCDLRAEQMNDFVKDVNVKITAEEIKND